MNYLSLSLCIVCLTFGLKKIVSKIQHSKCQTIAMHRMKSVITAQTVTNNYTRTKIPFDFGCQFYIQRKKEILQAHFIQGSSLKLEFKLKGNVNNE